MQGHVLASAELIGTYQKGDRMTTAGVYGEHQRLRPVSAQVQVLPERSTTHDSARRQRRRS